MARNFFLQKRYWLVTVLLVLLASGLIWLYIRFQTRAFVEVVTAYPLHAVQEASTADPAARLSESGSSSGSTGGSTPSGSPRVELSASFYDFGVVSAQVQAHHDFLIINRGSAPLVISQAYTTCGCTTADLTASLIPPGKAARAAITFDAGLHTSPGQTVRRGLILQTNDPEHPEVEIWVQARVK